ncbi:MAG: hypothetical protein IIA87_01145 [Nanoarchaeota archaeon]|nr:hypothetical protein [Nanoarchaeota archaeon]
MPKTRCEICDRNFKNEEALEMHNKAKHSSPEKKERKPIITKKIRNWTILVVVLIVIIGGIYFTFANIKTLPPTDMQGHIEVNPPSHVMREPMGDLIQKHMLEHADGSGPPGIIINYNCKDYNCDVGLIEKLEAFADKYPANVYVAPFPKMDAKIALTKLGKIQVLDGYDEQAIEGFIQGF